MIRHSERELRYVYSAAIPRSRARRSAFSRLVRVFYEGSIGQAVNGLLDLSVDRLSEAELEALAEKIDQARRKKEE